MGIKERKAREKEMRRKHIQIAAKKVFMLKGYYTTTIEDISKEAELSPATIYLYFKNKGELFASLILVPFRYLLELVQKVHDDKKLSVEWKVAKLKDIMYKTYQYDPLMLRNIFHFQIGNNLPDSDDNVLKEINDIYHKMSGMLQTIYAEGVRQGKFVEMKGVIWADIIWGLFSGLVLWEEAKRKVDPQKDYLKPTLDRAFDIFLRGIRKK